ncbi:flagellar brake domain-containing protein [Alteromonas sp. CYL-A6]|uniref:flagellar brake domain-containing protein n=1 Tax=Alteromonas nitratireducens TaxID=3390813 RepID=UPI0034C39E5D
MPEQSSQLTLSRDNIESLKTLTPGDTIDLQITTPTSPRRVKTQYVGMDLPNCMIFQMPTNAKWLSIRDLLPVGNDLVIRHVIEGDAGQVIAFRVKVLKLLSRPSGLLFTTFPSSMQAIGLRAERRSQPGIAVVVKSPAFGKSQEDATGIIVDVSAKGCRVAMPVNPEAPVLEADEAITLAYVVEGENVDITATIKNSKIEKETIFYGIQFDEGQKAVNTLLQRHVLLE